jgi:hypothetical protein
MQVKRFFAADMRQALMPPLLATGALPVVSS